VSEVISLSCVSRVYKSDGVSHHVDWAKVGGPSLVCNTSFSSIQVPDSSNPTI
jgi:hypothetical protein